MDFGDVSHSCERQMGLLEKFSAKMEGLLNRKGCS
jgi:hypothetical protein